MVDIGPFRLKRNGLRPVIQTSDPWYEQVKLAGKIGSVIAGLVILIVGISYALTFLGVEGLIKLRVALYIISSSIFFLSVIFYGKLVRISPPTAGSEGDAKAPTVKADSDNEDEK